MTIRISQFIGYAFYWGLGGAALCDLLFGSAWIGLTIGVSGSLVFVGQEAARAALAGDILIGSMRGSTFAGFLSFLSLLAVLTWVIVTLL